MHGWMGWGRKKRTLKRSDSIKKVGRNAVCGQNVHNGVPAVVLIHMWRAAGMLINKGFFHFNGKHDHDRLGAFDMLTVFSGIRYS